MMMSWFVVTGVLVVSVIVDVINASSLDSCLSSQPPSGYNQWTNNVINWNVKVAWAPERVCTTMNTCFGLNQVVDTPISVYQLIPVAMQPGMILGFQVNTNALGSPPNMTYIKVDETGFAACDGSSGVVVPSSMSSSGLQIISSSFLQNGSNYFIANSSSLLWMTCQYGMRLNVTVQPWSCSVGMSSTNLACSGSGLCVAGPWEASFHCDCCVGYMGSYCQLNNACSTQPCFNGGTCTNTVYTTNLTPLFTCLCPPGFTGDTCEVQSSVCIVNRCQNNAQCYMKDVTDFVCNCQPGFSGPLCENELTACGSNPCLNGGQCTDYVTSYTCLCPTGFSGVNCNTSHAATCNSLTCLNGGTCVTQSSGTVCTCSSGYTGTDCSTKISLCIPSPCKYAIACVDYGTSFSCTCQPGFTGQVCNININECASSPCVNNGTCYDMVAEFLCVCDAMSAGTRCENTITSVAPPSEVCLCGTTAASDSKLIRDLGIAAGVLFAILLIVLLVLLAYHFRLHVKIQHCFRKQHQYVKHIEVPASPRRI